MTTTTSRFACVYCGADDVPLTAWLPERYRSVGFSPGSFSADELEDVCDPCVVAFSVSHDPKVPRKPRPVPRKPWFESYSAPTQ